MIALFSRHKRIFLLSGITICIAAIIISITASTDTSFVGRSFSNIVTPLQRGTSAIIGWVQGHFSTVANNSEMLERLRALEEDNNRLRLENDRLRLSGEENELLSIMLNMSQRYAELPTMGARVIGVNPNDWYRRFFINRGTDDGISTNMAIIGDGGLVGVVRQTRQGSAQVITLIDSEFSVAVMSTRTGDIGMARGDIRLMQQGLLRMERIDAAVQIIPGDEIRTSTHSSIFPPGVLVGTVVSIHPNPDGHTRYALIRPAANLDNLEIVLVVAEVFGDASATQDGHYFGIEE